MTARGFESVATVTSVERPLTQAEIGARIASEYPGLRRLICRKIGDASIAEEILNEAICITWKKWRDGKLAIPEKVTGFVLGVAMNVWNNRRRTAADRAERRADPQLLDSLAANDTLQDESFDGRMALQVRDIIRGLDMHRDRAVLVRFYLNEEDKQIICADMGLSSSQFLKVLHRARARLRSLMEEQGLKCSDFLGDTPSTHAAERPRQAITTTKSSRSHADESLPCAAADRDARHIVGKAARGESRAPRRSSRCAPRGRLARAA